MIPGVVHSYSFEVIAPLIQSVVVDLRSQPRSVQVIIISFVFYCYVFCLCVQSRFNFFRKRLDEYKHFHLLATWQACQRDAWCWRWLHSNVQQYGSSAKG